MAVKINQNFEHLEQDYVFVKVRNIMTDWRHKNPQEELYCLNIGDVSEPLSKEVSASGAAAFQDQSKKDTFRGYAEDVQGVPSLRQGILDLKYKNLGISLDEIFIGNGTKADLNNTLRLFSTDNAIALPNPGYPDYLDSLILSGHSGWQYFVEKYNYSNIISLPANEENGFIPALPQPHLLQPDIIYLNYPNNPTGAMISRGGLQSWVDYANQNGRIIFYDNVYCDFIRDREKFPMSIYEMRDADKCAIEFQSFSKNASFTGIRCSWMVVPKRLSCTLRGKSLNELKRKHEDIAVFGVSYPVQAAAAEVLNHWGYVEENIKKYLGNAARIKECFSGKLGLKAYGGEHSPYIWIKIPDSSEDSWDFFHRLLNETHVVGTPGGGFGSEGNRFIRLTGFGSNEMTQKAIQSVLNNRAVLLR